MLNSSGDHPTQAGPGVGGAGAPGAGGGGPLLAAGQVVAGQFEIVRLVGRGGMGEVYEVRHRYTKERLALKTILPAHLASERARERFIEEIRTARRLRHPGIVMLYDTGLVGASVFYTMEYLEGSSLRTLLRERGRLDVAEAVAILLQLCDALEYAHQILIHRDLSPENVFVLPDGTVKLLDFGLARAEGRATMTVTGAALGKAYYMSPEQRRDAAHVDARTDLYALGIMLFEMVTGELPVGHRRAGQIRPELPAECDELIGRCLVPVERRIKSVSEFRAGLRALQAATAPTGQLKGKEKTALPKAAKAARRTWRRWAEMIITVATATFTAAALVVIQVRYGGRPEQTFAGIDFVWIPPGEFLMGSPESEPGREANEGPQHRVSFATGFWMGKYEVTQAQWEAVMGSNPSRFEGDGALPVEEVYWFDCQEFIGKLNARGEGEFRLPSEAEWEYACRAGTTTAYSFGDIEANLEDYAWYSVFITHPVGQKAPNAWGLYDMHGNVNEWCQDWFHDSYSEAPTDGSAREFPEGYDRVVRGGGFSDDGRPCRSACRRNLSPHDRAAFIGFRVVHVGRAP